VVGTHALGPSFASFARHGYGCPPIQASDLDGDDHGTAVLKDILVPPTRY